MSLKVAVSDHAAIFARWLNRSEHTMSALIHADGRVLELSAAFRRRCGVARPDGSLQLPDLLVSATMPEVPLLRTPPLQSPVMQRLVALADGSSWWCAALEIDEGGFLLVGTLHEESHDSASGSIGGMLADTIALQRTLQQATDRLGAANARVEQLLRTDALTGLANRRALDERLSIELCRAARHRRPFAVLFCDIDHFKEVNDLYGHAAGDQALAGVANILARGSRTEDLPGRYGGEEFLVLLVEADAAGAVVAAERLRQAIAQHVIPDIGRPVTASFGVSAWQNSESGAELLARADRGLYAAKDRGRNRVCVGA